MTTPIPGYDQPRARVCGKCGSAAVRLRSRHSSWCARCFWQAEVDRLDPKCANEKLAAARTEQSGHAEVLQNLRNEIEKRQRLLAAMPFWRRWNDAIIRPEVRALNREVERTDMLHRECSQRIAGLEAQHSWRTHQHQNARAHLLLAQQMADKRQKLSAGNDQLRSAFADQCVQPAEFHVSQYIIGERDYRRGNTIDNFIRDSSRDSILRAFDNKCFVCSALSNLTLDHYALTKNQGGNYVLCARDTYMLHVNLVVLCRGCNSRKGQRSHLEAFSAVDRDRLSLLHRDLLRDLLADPESRRILARWYRIPSKVLPRS